MQTIACTNSLLGLKRSPRLRAASALLLGALAFGCGDSGDGVDDPGLFGTPGQVTTPQGTGTPGANGTPGAGGATGGGSLNPAGTPPLGTGTNPGSVVPPSGSTDPGTPPATGGTGGTGTTVPPATTGGASSQWCDVRAVLAKECGACHGETPAAGAPFPLVTYADLTAPHPTKAGKKVYERVGVRVHADQSQAENLGTMPPGRTLAADELSLIDAWVAAGAPAGADPTCAGAPTTPTEGEIAWPLPECDATYKIVSHGATIDSPMMVPAGQETHPGVAWDAPWGNEQVQAIAFKTITDNKKVLHHWILYAGASFIVGWAPGEDGIKVMPPDVGFAMPSGRGSLRMDMHYYNRQGTTTEPDNSGVEVCVVKKEHFRKNSAAVMMGFSNFLFSIPAGASNYEVKSTCNVTTTQPVTLLTASPHAHRYARRMIFTVTKKNGQTITMHDMPFTFGEQKSFALDTPVVIETGDKVNTTCVYTNDTNHAVTFGENTDNEMCFNFATYYPKGALSCGGLGLPF